MSGYASRKFVKKCNQIKSESALVKVLEEKIKNQSNTNRFFEKSNQRLKRELRSKETALTRAESDKEQLQKELDELKSEKKQLQKELKEQKEALQDVLDGDEMRSCKICNEPYNDTERETVKLECPHVLCKKCTIQVQRIGNSLCPFCRKFFGQFYPVKF